MGEARGALAAQTTPMKKRMKRDSTVVGTRGE